MNEAYVFQHVKSGVQIFVYHCRSVEDARNEFKRLVLESSNWVYLCKKVAEDAPTMAPRVPEE